MVQRAEGKIPERQKNEKWKVAGLHLAQKLVWEARFQAWLWLGLKPVSGEFILPSASLCNWWQRRVGGVSLSLGSSVCVAWALNRTPSFLSPPGDPQVWDRMQTCSLESCCKGAEVVINWEAARSPWEEPQLLALRWRGFQRSVLNFLDCSFKKNYIFLNMLL